MYGFVYIHNVPCLLGQPRNNDTLVAMSTSSAQILFPKYHSQIKEPGSLEKWVIPGPEWAKHRMRLEHLDMPEYTEMLMKGWGHVHRTLNPLERDPNGQSWDNFEQEKKQR